MLERQFHEHVQNGSATLKLYPVGPFGETRFHVFCLTENNQLIDVYRNWAPGSDQAARNPLTFGSLSSLYEWFRTHFPDEERLVLELDTIPQAMSKLGQSMEDVPSFDPNQIDTERYEAIKVALKARGISIRGLAEKIGVSHTAVIKVCKRDETSRQIQRAVAEALGLTRADLFDTLTGYKKL